MGPLALMLAGGVLYAGFKGFRQRKNASGGHPIISLLDKADRGCQRFFREKVDPLLDKSTGQQQLRPSSGNLPSKPPSEEEQEANRYIALSVVTMGLTATSRYLLPALLIPTTGFAISLLHPLYTLTIKDLVHKRKLRTSFLDLLYMAGFWVTGYYFFFGLTSLFYFLGNKVVTQMTNRSQDNLAHLFGQQPRSAWKLVNGVEVETPISALHAGDTIVVNAGEPLPVDGVIIEGAALVDQHQLTGESAPVDKEAGAPVFASTVLLSGRLAVRVEKAGGDTLSAQITEILQNTADHQTETELKGQKLADKTVLPNLAASALALPTVGAQGAVAILGAGLGFNIRLLSVLSLMNYLTIASRNGILVKDASALERLKDIDTIVFDKTGTLTLDVPHVSQVHVAGIGLSEDELLILAATAEYRQPHPIAKAIIGAAEQRGLAPREIEEASYEVGYGISVRVEGRLIRVGSSRFITREGLPLPAEIEALQATCQGRGHPLVLVAVDAQVAGAIELHATPRPEAGRVIRALQKRNLSLVILSGDQEEPTREMARELGIDSYFANALPENKAKLIERLQKEGRVVCFVGDGINDAMALKQADVSVSLRGATTIATDAAQIVLMDHSIEHLDYLFTLTGQLDNTLRAILMSITVPGAVAISGVFLAGFGIITSEILFQLGLFAGVGMAMRPLLVEKNAGQEPGNAQGRESDSMDAKLSLKIGKSMPDFQG